MACILLATASAQAQGIRPLKRIEVKTSRCYKLIQPDRLALVHDEPEWGEGDKPMAARRYHIIDFQARMALDLRLPFDPLYTEKWAGLFFAGPTWANKADQKFPTFDSWLVALDPDAGTGGLLLRDKFEDKQTRAWKNRHHYIAFDPKTGELDWSLLLEQAEGSRAQHHDYYLVSVGPEPGGQRHWFCSMWRIPTSDGKQLARIRLLSVDIQKRAIDFDHRFDTPPSENKRVASGLRIDAGPRFRFFSFREYSEKGDPQARMHVLDTTDKTHFSLPVPPTPYGCAIDRQGHFMAVASNQMGLLTLYDLRAKKQVRQVQCVRKIHKLVLSADDKRLFAFAHGRQAEIRAWPSLKRLERVQAKKAFSDKEDYFSPEVAVSSADGKIILLPPTKEYGFAKDDAVWVVELR